MAHSLLIRITNSSTVAQAGSWLASSCGATVSVLLSLGPGGPLPAIVSWWAFVVAPFTILWHLSHAQSTRVCQKICVVIRAIVHPSLRVLRALHFQSRTLYWSFCLQAQWPFPDSAASCGTTHSCNLPSFLDSVLSAPGVPFPTQFISATDTIRAMKSNVDGMGTDMEKLKTIMGEAHTSATCKLVPRWSCWS